MPSLGSRRPHPSELTWQHFGKLHQLLGTGDESPQPFGGAQHQKSTHFQSCCHAQQFLAGPLVAWIPC